MLKFEKQKTQESFAMLRIMETFLAKVRTQFYDCNSNYKFKACWGNFMITCLKIRSEKGLGIQLRGRVLAEYLRCLRRHLQCGVGEE